MARRRLHLCWCRNARLRTHRRRSASYKSAKLLISSGLNILVQSADFSLKTQPRLLLLPITPHGLTTAAVSSWVHLILSSNLSRKFKTLLQDSFSWHPVTTTQHLSWKNCTGFPFQNVLNMKSLVCVSVLKMVLVLLISLNCYMSALRLVHYALLLTPAC